MDRELTAEERIARRRAQREAEQRKKEQKEKRANEIFKRVNTDPKNAANPLIDAGVQSERNLAEAWARSTGLVDVPPKPHKFNGWICFILALFWFIPAIVYYFWCEARANAYAEAINHALRTWKANGSPDPYALAGSSPAVPMSPVEPGISQQLQELFDLKERGLLSEDEFVAAKKKLLGI